MYDGTPPWDIGRPQPAFVELEAERRIESPVLDVGCGTGETALFLAERRHDVVGVDLIARAIDRARHKAHERKLHVDFRVGDALALAGLGRRFRTVIDSAVFHVFDDSERVRYVRSLAEVLEEGGFYFMLVFSDAEPADWGGPRRIRREEIEAAFGSGWAIESIVPHRIETNFHPEGGGKGWLASIRRGSGGEASCG
jgi:SAM-dependent methyltransferase